MSSCWGLTYKGTDILFYHKLVCSILLVSQLLLVAGRLCILSCPSNDSDELLGQGRMVTHLGWALGRHPLELPSGCVPNLKPGVTIPPQKKKQQKSQNKTNNGYHTPNATIYATIKCPDTAVVLYGVGLDARLQGGGGTNHSYQHIMLFGPKLQNDMIEKLPLDPCVKLLSMCWVAGRR